MFLYKQDGQTAKRAYIQAKENEKFQREKNKEDSRSEASPPEPPHN